MKRCWFLYLVFAVATLWSLPCQAQQLTTTRNGTDFQVSTFSNGVTDEDLRRMKTATWLNQNQIELLVNFTNMEQNPYPSGPYDVSIDKANCYVVFRDPDKNTYDLITAKEPPLNDDSYGTLHYGVFLSHVTPCGVCSNLVDLAVYLESPDLTNPVRLCGFTAFLSGSINKECLTGVIGFSKSCGAIWFHNTQHTRTNCLFPCLVNLASPANMGFGLLNPCRPSQGTDEDGDWDGGCQNTINKLPACQDFQYQTGSRYRLNSCLQCDECNSGPMFQKIAGRTRRASGITSDIDRPDIPQILHNYFTSKK